MKKYIGNIKLLFVFVLFFAVTMSASATTLPSKIIDTINAQLPSNTIRFDGLITASDGTTYIPVLSTTPDRETKGEIVSTYPAGLTLSQKPEVVLFDNNFALLKVVKLRDGRVTITDSKNIPFVVKTGLFPQDMLVPPGLVIPDELQIMMGDLRIATQSSRVNDIFGSAEELNKGLIETKFTPVKCLANKTLLITSIGSKLISAVPTNSTNPKFTLTLENLPKFVKPVNNGQYILVAAAGKTYIDVADVRQEVLAKKIDLTYQPSEIILSNDKLKAYVAVSDSQSIFVIDLENMSLLEKIKVKGYPKNITISRDGNIIAYQDKNTGDVYVLELNDRYLNKFVYNASNVSKIVVENGTVYLLSRTEDLLLVVDIATKNLIYKQEVAQKPVDMQLIDNNLYILSSVNELVLFNTEDFSYQSVLKLPDSGFTSKLVKVENSNLFLITNVTEKQYTIYDYVNNTVLQSVKTPLFISDLQILDSELK